MKTRCFLVRFEKVEHSLPANLFVPAFHLGSIREETMDALIKPHSDEFETDRVDEADLASSTPTSKNSGQIETPHPPPSRTAQKFLHKR